MRNTLRKPLEIMDFDSFGKYVLRETDELYQIAFGSAFSFHKDIATECFTSMDGILGGGKMWYDPKTNYLEVFSYSAEYGAVDNELLPLFEKPLYDKFKKELRMFPDLEKIDIWYAIDSRAMTFEDFDELISSGKLTAEQLEKILWRG